MARLGREIEVTLVDGRALCVRDARTRDARPVARLLDDVAAEPQVTLLLLPGEAKAKEWRGRIADTVAAPRSLFLVASVERRVAGTLSLWPDSNPSSAHVAWLGMSVGRETRRLGAGGALLEAALTWAEAHEYARAVLSVFPHNRGALAFYERHGFVREGLRRAQFRRADEYHDEVLMARTLTNGS